MWQYNRSSVNICMLYILRQTDDTAHVRILKLFLISLLFKGEFGKRSDTAVIISVCLRACVRASYSSASNSNPQCSYIN